MIVGPAGWGPAPLAPRKADDVVFTGPVPDPVLAELYRRARAFAYVPLTEGYGLPPLEAMRAGLPTVVSNEVPSVHDLDAPGPAPARIVDPLDVDDIAAGLAAVLTDDALRADLARRGRDPRVDAHLARHRPRPPRPVAVPAMTGDHLDLSLDVSAVPARPGGAGYYTMALARGLAGRDDVALTLIARRRRRGSAGAAWPPARRCAARSPARGRAGWSSSNSGSVPCCAPSGCRSTTDRTTRCRPGRRCPAP